MPDAGTPDDGTSDRSVGPIDADVLGRIETHLAGSERFSDVEYRPSRVPNSVIAEYDLGYFPPGVVRAYLEVRWYETDDWNVHYSEHYESGTQWECRWDRHPNDHNAREHFHPPPTAETPGDDAEFPRDWRAVVALILGELDDHVASFWE